MYAKYLKEEDEKEFLDALLAAKGYIAIDPKESNPNTLAYLYAEHPDILYYSYSLLFCSILQLFIFKWDML